jgi:hypothetical protein
LSRTYSGHHTQAPPLRKARSPQGRVTGGKQAILRIAILGPSQGLLLTFRGHTPERSVGVLQNRSFDRKTTGPLHLSRHCWRHNRPVGQHHNQKELQWTGCHRLSGTLACYGKISLAIPESTSLSLFLLPLSRPRFVVVTSDDGSVLLVALMWAIFSGRENTADEMKVKQLL